MRGQGQSTAVACAHLPSVLVVHPWPTSSLDMCWAMRRTGTSGHWQTKAQAACARASPKALHFRAIALHGVELGARGPRCPHITDNRHAAAHRRHHPVAGMPSRAHPTRPHAHMQHVAPAALAHAASRRQRRRSPLPGPLPPPHTHCAHCSAYPRSELELRKSGAKGRVIVDDPKKYPGKEDIGPMSE